MSSNQKILTDLDQWLSPCLERSQSPLLLAAHGESDEEPEPALVQFNRDLFYALLGYLKSEGVSSPEETALRINDLLPERPETLEDGFGLAIDFSNIVIGVCLEIPYAHIYQDRMVSLMVSLCELPESIAKPHFASYGSGWYTVRDGVLGYGIRERWDDRPSYNIPGAYEIRKEQAADGPVEPALRVDNSAVNNGVVDRWIRLQALTARLISIDILAGEFKHYFVWCFRDSALERPCDNTDVLSCDLSACSMWILYAGEQFYSRIDYQPNEFVSRAERGGILYTGPPGFRVERWMFWKKRFSDLLTQYEDRLSEEAKGHTRASIAKMGEIDRNWVRGTL